MKQKARLKDLEAVEALSPEVLFEPISLSRNDPYSVYNEDSNTNFLKLLQTINSRAANFDLDCELPKMDLSALYCLGLTIQEYSRYLGMDIVTEKRAIDKLPPLNTLFTKEEKDDREIVSIIERHKEKKTIEDIPSIPTKLNEKRNLNNIKSYRNYHRFHVATKQGESYYDKILNSSDWSNALRKKPGAETIEKNKAEAKIRREKNKIVAQQLASERAVKLKQEKEAQQQKLLEQKVILDNKSNSKKRLNQDIFDTSKKTKIPKKVIKKKKSVNPF